MENTPRVSTTPPAAKSASRAWLVVVLIGIAVAVLVGIVWSFGQRERVARVVEPPPPPPVGEPPMPASLSDMLGVPEADAKTRALGDVGSSSDLGAIEQDLSATDVAGADQELGDIEKELQ